MAKSDRASRFWTIAALLAMIVWIVFWGHTVYRQVGLDLASLPVGELGGVIAGLVGPVALIWVLALLEARG